MVFTFALSSCLHPVRRKRSSHVDKMPLAGKYVHADFPHGQGCQNNVCHDEPNTGQRL
jgi:hypothetical protein